MIETPGKWFDYRKFHLLFEKWNPIKHSRPTCIKGYGGWLAIRNLPLEYWNRATFEAIGSHFGGLEEIALETLNFLNVSEAKIKVQKNLCGFMPASIEIKNELRGSVVLNFGDNEAVEAPSYVHKELFYKDFNNSIDQYRVNKVAEDEVGGFSSLSRIREGRKFIPSSEKVLEKAEGEEIVVPKTRNAEGQTRGASL